LHKWTHVTFQSKGKGHHMNSRLVWCYHHVEFSQYSCTHNFVTNCFFQS
jgi:hypothetical protein